MKARWCSTIPDVTATLRESNVPAIGMLTVRDRAKRSSDSPGPSAPSITAEEVEAIRQAAWEEGLAEGRAAGFAKGLEEGKLEGLQQGHQAGLEQGREEGLAMGRDQVEQEAGRG